MHCEHSTSEGEDDESLWSVLAFLCTDAEAVPGVAPAVDPAAAFAAFAVAAV